MLQRILDKIEFDTNGGCWLWSGKVHPDGYGYIWLDGRKQRTNRVSWEAFNGSIPAGVIVRHKCDVPTCLNPEHLLLGSHSDNTADKVSRNRHAQGDATKPKLSLCQVYELRALHSSGMSIARLAARYGISKPSVRGRLRGPIGRTAKTSETLMPSAGDAQ